MPDPEHSFIDARGVRLHVIEQGSGPAVLFCHGFPAIWSSWRSAMQAAADAGFRAIALDMRGYGKSAAPAAVELYTPFHTVGDLIAVLDHFGAERAYLIGHDFGANIAWNAAMMRPDRIAAVFGTSVPFLQPGGASVLDQLRAGGVDDFYMFAQMREDADIRWSDAARTIPDCLYWTSGEPAPSDRWDPFDPTRHMLRSAPMAPATIDRAYIEEAVAAFSHTGFHGPLNYYRAIDGFFAIANRAFAGSVIRQPSFFLTGSADGLNAVRNPTEETLRTTIPGLKGFCSLEGIGHWPQLEAPDDFNAALVQFLRSL